jgi:uncharacterized protein YkwD
VDLNALRVPAVIAVVIGGLALIAPRGDGRWEGATACDRADVLPGEAGVEETRTATLCLLNERRAARGLEPLRENRRLERAADAHARDMVDRDLFSHDSADGRSAAARIAEAGYGDAAQVGENLAYGTGREGSPGAVVEGWIESPGHRANVLAPGYREIGLGIVEGVPARDESQPGLTYVTDFGRR